MDFFKVVSIAVVMLLTGCVSTSPSVSTSVSPVDGKSRTDVSASLYSMSHVLSVDGESGLGIEGGTVVDGEYAFILFRQNYAVSFLDASFNADGLMIEMEPANVLTDFKVSEYGTTAKKSFIISCSDLLKVAKSKDVYLRVNYISGFVDYSVSAMDYGYHGFQTIKDIASHCNK
jgi:hypothetical protein